MNVFCEDIPFISHTPVNKSVCVCVFKWISGLLKFVQYESETDQIFQTNKQISAEATELIPTV